MTTRKTYTLDEIEEETGFDRRTVAYYVQQGLLPKVGRRGPKTRYSQLFLDRLSFIRLIRDLQDQGDMGTVTLSDFRDLFQRVPDELIAEVVSGGISPDVIERLVHTDGPEAASFSIRRATMAEKIDNLRRKVSGKADSEPLKSAGAPMDPARGSSPMSEKEKAFIARAYQPLAGEQHAGFELEDELAESRGLDLDGAEQVLGAAGAKPLLGSPTEALEEELRDALARLHAVVERQPRAYLRTSETWTQARITGELGLSARGLEDRHLPLLERVAQILRHLLQDQLGSY
jgi:DNA-binding transcriptional MerR regulator